MGVSSYHDIHNHIRSLQRNNPQQRTPFLDARTCPTKSYGSFKYHYSPSLYPFVTEWDLIEPTTIQFCIDFRFFIFHQGIYPPVIYLTEEEPHALSLWTSKPIKIASIDSPTLLDDAGVSTLLISLIEGVLGFGSNQHLLPFYVELLRPSSSDFKNLFNLSFLTLTFLFLVKRKTKKSSIVCENCIVNLYKHLFCSQLQGETLTLLKKIRGADLETKWTRLIHLEITSWLQTFEWRGCRPIFSYCNCTDKFWEVQLYCPLISTGEEKTWNKWRGNRNLRNGLEYHQLESVIQFHYSIESDKLILNLKNIRIKVVKLNKELKIGGMHFPSRIQLRFTPISQVDMSLTVGQSTANPTREYVKQHGCEFGLSNLNPVGKYTYVESVKKTLEFWKHVESSEGDRTSIHNWILQDIDNEKRVSSSKPPKRFGFNAWFNNIESGVDVPISGTKEYREVVFAEDKYKQPTEWKMKEDIMGKKISLLVQGKIWVTYWPHKNNICYAETRSVEFRHDVVLTIQ